MPRSHCFVMPDWRRANASVRQTLSRHSGPIPKTGSRYEATRASWSSRLPFLNPKRPGEMIAIESGVPGHEDPVHSGPYLKISRNGATERIHLRGNPALGD